jgi:hypothetical protein
MRGIREQEMLEEVVAIKFEVGRLEIGGLN